MFFDCLEDRQLLSANALTAATSAPLVVSDPTTSIFGTSSPRAVAMDNAGDAAAVWMSPDANGDGNVTMNYAYYANGALSSPGSKPTFEGTVDSGVPASSSGSWVGWAPVLKVAMAPDGEFVVLWGTSANTSSGNRLSTTFTTYAQVFDPASGGSVTGHIVVGAASGASNQARSVAINDNGFDVLYDAGSTKNSSLTKTVQRYDLAGQALGSPISVAPTNDSYEAYLSGSISMDDSGDFVVVWDTDTGAWANPGNYFYVDAQRYNNAGQAQGNVIQVNPNVAQWPNVQRDSSVSMDPTSGDFVVAWNGSRGALLARQFEIDTTTGTLVEEPAITVATSAYNTVDGINPAYPNTTYNVQSGGPSGAASVTALPGHNGAFDVTWTNYYRTLISSYNSTTGVWGTPAGWYAISHQDIYAKSYDSSGKQTQWLTVTNDLTSSITDDDNSSASSSATDPNGNLLVLWNDANQANVQVDAQLYKEESQPAQSGFSISTSSSSATAGQAFDVTVTAPAGYTGTIYLASSAASVDLVSGDPSRQGLPASVTFTNGGVTSWSGNLTSATGGSSTSGGSATFSVALETAGLQTVTATSADGSITTSADVTVAPAALASFDVGTLGPAVAGTPSPAVVTALDKYGNVDTNYSGPIDLTSSDSTATFSAVTWVNGVGTFTVTFNETSTSTVTETITVTDTATGISETSGGISVSPAARTTSGGGGKKH